MIRMLTHYMKEAIFHNDIQPSNVRLRNLTNDATIEPSATVHRDRHSDQLNIMQKQVFIAAKSVIEMFTG